MAPNPRVLKAFRAMKDLEIDDKKVKPVLKKLLKLYDKKWELIEEDNYRVLIDAIFDEEEPQAPEENGDATEDRALEEETQMQEEPERPLKRLRRGQDGQASSSRNNGDLGQHSLSPRKPQASKGKEPLLPAVVSREKRPNMKIVTSTALRFKDPMLLSGDVLLPKQTTHALIKPKEEPFTDDVPFNDTPQPIAIVRPDSASKQVQDPAEPPTPLCLAREDREENLPASSTPEEDPTNLEIASSQSGEVKISLSCNSILRRPNFHVPSQDELLKSMQEKCLQSYKILDPNFSVKQMLKDMCECFLELATDSSHESQELATDSSHESQERLLNVTPALDILKKSPACSVFGAASDTPFVANGSVDAHVFDGEAAAQIPGPPQSSNGLEDMHSSKEVIANGFPESDKGNEVRDAELGTLMVVPQCQLTLDEFWSLHNLNDITKGEEWVQIPWLNEINNEFPASFNYIPRNLIFQNANVRLTLSKIRAENCCSTCIGDCLSSPTPCACSSEAGFAYSSEGFVKEDFLEDCISVTRDPQRQSLFYCGDCPLERAKNDEMLEPCKGHLKRKYIKECWSKCGCHKQCGNRVVQRGIKCKLQVFFTSEGKGWGLRTLEKLPKGTFVCEYVGEILTNGELYERKRQMSRRSKTEKHAYPILLDSNWSLKGVMKDEEALCLDATFLGNVARFINHRCLDANLIEIPVMMETPEQHYYHLAFFTTREVDALEELTWDYGIDFDDNDQPVEAFQCRCGSKFCRNMKRSNRSKLTTR